MDINGVLDELRRERDNLSETILSLERLAIGSGKRRGRPPAWMAAIKERDVVPKKRGRPAGSRNKATAT